eukprot:Ihof_evm1s1137 gene=Ihof_evmTU1s1137
MQRGISMQPQGAQVGWNQRVFLLLDDPESSRGAFVYALVVASLNVLYFVALWAHSVEEWHSDKDMGWCIETAFVSVVSGEFIIRLLTTSRVRKFLINPFNIIDIVSLIPYFA